MKNIIEKIWEAHTVRSEKDMPDVLGIDFHLMHEVTTPQAFSVLREKKLDIWDKNRCIATVDHNVSTAQNRQNAGSEESKNQLQTLRKNCVDFGIKLLDMDSGHQGIVHVIGPELGITQPGMTIVCGDSHTATHGAFGALAFGIGTTEVSHTMATGCLFQQKPKTMKVEFRGKMSKNVTAKDLVLKLIQQIGIGGGTGYIIEYTGETIQNMDMEGRMTICNMSIEAGARSGLVSPDDTTINFLREKIAVKDFEKAKNQWLSFASDTGAMYDKTVVVDINNMKPMITWGTNPEQGIEIDQTIPMIADISAEKCDTYKAALKYVGLQEGQSMIGVPIDYVFLGSCTNSRLVDLEQAAEILKGKKIAENVKLMVIPGSEEVKKIAEKKELDKVFIEAGGDWRNPGCSACLGMNEDQVPAGARCASTSNRNFVGRQGIGSITHLMSPIMAAAAALEGKITD